ncbi:MAG TPA: FecR domain-containing protein [Candidatus Omnitrophota bacterium]|nr:FecR domain-containing protein [Candidatus Omnitrophota bacterium]HPS37213.1 FecR domain-containing protein [Candidatus Omnitrophota bacterium]
MKKILFLALVLFFLAASSGVFAQMSVPMAGSVMAPAGLEKIGVVAAAKGKVELKTPGQIGRVVQSGQSIYLGDEIRTDAEGHLQILLLDETVFTIGPNSAIVIDEFVYDPKTQEGKIKANVTEGFFRYVSGKIAAKRPSSVTMKLPSATIGFRGTIVLGQTGQTGSLVMLGGPGGNNNAGENPGSFTLTGEGSNSGESREVTGAGFGVQVDGSGGLSGVFQVPGDQVNQLTGNLDGSGGTQGGGSGGSGGSGGGDSGLTGGGSASDLSGESLALTGDAASLTAGLDGLMNQNDNFLAETSQDMTSQSGSSGVQDGTTTVAELATIPGSYHYSVSGSLYNSYGSAFGSFSANWDLDVQTGKILMGSTGSYVEVTIGSVTESATINAQNLIGETNAVMSETYATGNIKSVDITLENLNGVVAQTGNATVHYDNGSVDVGSGTGSGERSPGPLSPA